MEQLSKEYFEQWMARITERIIDDADFCQILNISARTSQRYRTEGLIPYSVLRQRVYYKESDVWAFIRKNKKDKGGKVAEKIDQAKRPSWK